MSMIASMPTRVKFDSRKAPAPASFGAGLEVPDWSEVDRSLASDSELTPLDPDDTTIPQSARWIRVVDGPKAGAYEAVADPHGRREWRALDGSGVRLMGDQLDRLYEVARVAILSAAPKAPERPAKPPVWSTRDIRPTPTPEPAGPSVEDAMFWSGRSLAAAGIDARPCPSWPADLQAAFRAGAAEGLEAFDADMSIEAERWMLLERACGRGHHDQAEYREVGMRAPFEG